MQKSDIVRTPRPRALEPIAWGMAVLLVTAILVQLTHRGIDILLALAAGFVLLSVERTLGDWIAESVGEPATILLFALVALLVIAYATTDKGQSRVQRILATADAQGIQPLVLWSDRASPGSPSNGSGRSASPSETPAVGVRAGPASPTVGGRSRPAAGTAEPEGPPNGGPLVVDLKADPEVVVTGEAVTLRAAVHGDQPAVGAAAVFTVNGDVIAKIAFDYAGNASTRFTPAVPGYYTARLRISPSSIFRQDTTATFSVLPGR